MNSRREEGNAPNATEQLKGLTACAVTSGMGRMLAPSTWRVRRAYKKAQALIKQKKRIPVWLSRKCVSYKGILDHTNSQNIERRYNTGKTIRKCRGVISYESKVRCNTAKSFYYAT